MLFLPSCPGVKKKRQSSGSKGPGEVVGARRCCEQRRFINRVPVRHPFTDEATMATVYKLVPTEQPKLPPNRERDLMFFLLGAWVVRILELLLQLH